MGTWTANPSILSSESSFAKFIIETALDNLYADLTNLRIIEDYIKAIRKERINTKKINVKWEAVKEKHFNEFGYWNNSDITEELSEYEDCLNEISKKYICKTLGDKPHPGKLLIRQRLWKIAITKSHRISDDSTEQLEPEWDRQYKMLKERYGEE